MFRVDDGPDEHGRVYKKGGSQIMHFTGLRRIDDCIATSTGGHVSLAMAELMFHRRGTCMRKSEKALLVYLAALHYLSKVCLPKHALFDYKRQVHYGYATTRERRLVAGALQKALHEHGITWPNEKATLSQSLAREEHLLHQTGEVTKRRIPHEGV
jgi:hypothetical protein